MSKLRRKLLCVFIVILAINSIIIPKQICYTTPQLHQTYLKACSQECLDKERKDEEENELNSKVTMRNLYVERTTIPSFLKYNELKNKAFEEIKKNKDCNALSIEGINDAKTFRIVYAALEAEYFPYEDEAINYLYGDDKNYTFDAVKIWNEFIHENNIYNLADKEIKSIGIDTSWTKEDAIKAINENICNDCEYQLNNRDVTCIMEESRGNCMAYAEYFDILCNSIGINTRTIIGNDGTHEWNFVIINNAIYYIDVCWNDNNTENNHEKYMLMDEDELLKTHNFNI